MLESRCFNALKYVTAPSEYVKSFLIEEYGLSASRIAVVPHGVNIDDFTFIESLQTESDHVQLLAVGRVTDQKGFELLVRAMPKILACAPRTTLTVVGDGGGKSSLLNLVAALNLENHVEIKNSVDKSVLATAYAKATMLIIPSQFEPFGLVGLEAMACGCPVLAIAPTGASEYLEITELTPNYQISGLAAAVLNRLKELRCSSDPRQDARRRAEKFTWEKAANAYTDLYKKVML